MQKETTTIADLAFRFKGRPRDTTVVMILTPNGPKPLGVSYGGRCYVQPDGTVKVLYGDQQHAAQGIEPQPLVILAPAGEEWRRSALCSVDQRARTRVHQRPMPAYASRHIGPD